MKELHYWAHWFHQLAQRIDTGGESWLVEKAHEVDWGPKSPFLLQAGKEAIDPLSFLYTLAQRAPMGIGQTVYDSVASCFELDTAPDVRNPEFRIFPQPIAIAAAVFGKQGAFNRSLYWGLFRQSIGDTRRINSSVFDDALEVPMVGMKKLTHALFLANPLSYVPSDVLKTILDYQDEPYSIEDHNGFTRALDKVKETYLGCHAYEINWFIWNQFSSSDPLINKGSRFFHVTTKQGGFEYWDNFLQDYIVFTDRVGPNVAPGTWRTPTTNSDSINADYRLDQPTRGDIILVRTGTSKGRAIGVVYQNDYSEPKGFNEDSRIHVSWINKSDAAFSVEDAGVPHVRKFSETRPSATTNYTLAAFRTGYPDTFKVIDRLSGQTITPESSLDDTTNTESSLDSIHDLNQILFGPPGTSKTWNTVTVAVAIIENRSVRELKTIAEQDRQSIKNKFDAYRDSGRISMVTFHQNTTYEDFIEGIRPELQEGDSNAESGDIRYRVSRGIFRKIAMRAEDDPANRYVLIIDEINRGNIARIFGELITLIEDSKRIGEEDEARIRLLVSKEEFGVPSNLHLVGTMNTADRSIALLDTALRRRFTFVEMMPDPNHALISSDAEGVNCRLLLQSMNRRIAVLLDREHQVGHTYFLRITTVERLKEIFLSRVLPLLQEYFYEDWEKIRAVLGENRFIQRSDPPQELVAKGLVDQSHAVFEVLPEENDSWLDPQEYRSIYKPAGGGGGPEGSD